MRIVVGDIFTNVKTGEIYRIVGFAKQNGKNRILYKSWGMEIPLVMAERRFILEHKPTKFEDFDDRHKFSPKLCYLNENQWHNFHVFCNSFHDPMTRGQEKILVKKSLDFATLNPDIMFTRPEMKRIAKMLNIQGLQIKKNNGR